jgi:heterodisulfide reductase subunit B
MGDRLPVLYFTQLMAVAMGLNRTVWGIEDHYVSADLLSSFGQPSTIDVQ